MTDWTGIAAVLAPITTLAGVLGGYMLAGMNDEARDQRAAQRESQARRDALSERLEEARHTFQQDTLLELQNELHKLARITTQVILHDERTIRDAGQLTLLPDGLSDDGMAVMRSVGLLQARVLDAHLRITVGTFANLCARFCSPIADLPRGEVPEDKRERMVSRLKRRMTELDEVYEQLMIQLGGHLRRELDRRYLAT